MRRLLLLACSRSKHMDTGLMPAIERYNGPPFQVLRRYARAYPLDVPDVYILSAEYGLIQGNTWIPSYDRLMTKERSYELRPSVTNKLQSLELAHHYHQVFVYASATYRDALSAPDLTAYPPSRLSTACGSQGVRLAQFKLWLYRGAMARSTTQTVRPEPGVPIRFTLKGKVFEISPTEAHAMACSALHANPSAENVASLWYTSIHGHKVAPKWLLSQLTGVPVREFHTGAALRVLRQLGFGILALSKGESVE